MSASSKNESRPIRIGVIGSARADQPDFVQGLLNGFEEVFDIGCVISGPCSGADAFAREWAQSKKIPYEGLDIDIRAKGPTTATVGDLTRLSFFDSHRKLSATVLKHDPQFEKAFSAIQRSAPDFILAIPAPDGMLGPATACVKRIAEVLGIPVMNGAEALQAINSKMQSALDACASEIPEVSVSAPEAPRAKASKVLA